MQADANGHALGARSMSLQEDRANPGLQAALAISANWTKCVETIIGMNSGCQRPDRQCQVAQARCVAAAELLATGCNLDRKNPRAKEDITHLPPEQLAENIWLKEQRIEEIIVNIKSLLAKHDT